MNRFLNRFTLLLLAGCALISPARAQYVQQGPKLVAADAVGGGQLHGLSVAISADGNTAIVGAPSEDSQAGAARIYIRTGGVWTQEGSKLVGTGAVGFPNQGHSVDISADGNTAILGARGDDSDVGAAWIFTKSGGVWSQQGSKLVGTGSVGKPEQGTSVALSADGNTALIGGPFDNAQKGAVWVFKRTGGVWAQVGSKLVGTGAVGFGSWAGISVDLSADGSTAVVGGNRDNSYVGAAWVFTESGGTWTQQGSKLVGTGAVGMSDQGWRVAISPDGSTILVGGSGDDLGNGATWVFVNSAGVWSQQGGKLVGGSAASPAYQGSAVSLSYSGDTAIVGGHADNASVGAAWAFTRSAGVWTQYGGKLVGADYIGQPFQGASVSLSHDGRTAIVGGHFDNENSQPTGAAWVYAIGKTITVTQGPHGTIVPGTTVVTAGGDQEFIITPSPGYAVDSVFVDDVYQGPLYSYQFNDVTADHSLRAVFAPIDLTQGLAAYYPFNGNANDESGNGNDATPDTPALTTDLAGEPNSAYLWNGIDDKMRVPDADAFKITGSLSIVGWALPYSSPPGRAAAQIVFRGDDRIGIDPYYLALMPDGDLRFHISSGTEDKEIEAPMSYGSWQHFAATLDSGSGEMKIYLFASAVHTDTTSVRPFRNLDPGESPGIGLGNTQSYDPGTHHQPFDGKLDELRIYNRALSPVEISWLFQQAPRPRSTRTIVATAGPNGRIVPADTVVVDSGSNQTFTFFPDPGFTVDDVEVDGGSVPAAGSLTFVNVTEHHTIHVSFRRSASMPVLAVEQSGASRSVRFGVREGAAYGIWGVDPAATSVDSAAGEVEHPPPPPESFDARFVGPHGEYALFGIGSPVDVRPYTDPAQADTFLLRFWRTPDGTPVKVRWSPAVIGAYFGGLATIGPALDSMVDMKTTDSLLVADTLLTGLFVVTASPVPPVTYPAGWNLVSLAGEVEDGTPGALFPGFTATPFSYDAATGYQTETELREGRGYWMRFSSPARMAGPVESPRSSDTIDISAGWNLIGSLGSSVPVSSIVSDPPGMVTGPFYGYDRGYIEATDLEPTRGYWVKATQSGRLILSSFDPAVAGRIVIRPTGETPPAPPSATDEMTGLVPVEYSLGQNYPNPFNPTTTLTYGLPADGVVRVQVVNVLGQEVALLENGYKTAGIHAVVWDAAAQPSGVYFYTIVAGSFSETKRMVLLR